MDILLDTHILLWHLTDNPRLSQAQSAMIEDPTNRKFFSMASLWEIAIKTSIGKLDVGQSLDKIVPVEIIILDIKLPHIQEVQILPLHHKDPFDRLIIAQALVEGIKIMTDDGNFLLYDVELL